MSPCTEHAVFLLDYTLFTDFHNFATYMILL